jgi:hypothetical protein
MRTTRLALAIPMAGALLAASLIASPAFAEADAGSGVPADATGTTDAGSTDAGPTDAGSGDAVGTPDSTTGTTGGYTVNPCWEEKCKAEVDACKADKDCDAWAKCIKAGGSQQDCANQLKVSGIPKGFTALSECGWKTCNDPNAGSCGAPGKQGKPNRCGQWDDSWACNCDDACTQFNDCCKDKDTVCSGTTSGPSCKGMCDAGDMGGCYCDGECTANKDCCPDYEKECGGGGTCVPKCDGKQCGPDGCQGTCGSCPTGSICNAAAGTCGSGNTGGTDAGTGGGSDTTGGGTDAGTGGSDGTGGASDGTGGGGDGSTASDGTGGTGGTGGNTTPPASSSSSGCTAAPSSNGAAGLLLVIGLMACLVGLRRRYA